MFYLGIGSHGARSTMLLGSRNHVTSAKHRWSGVILSAGKMAGEPCTKADGLTILLTTITILRAQIFVTLHNYDNTKIKN